MTKANKIGEGVYRTEDGQWQIVKTGDNWDIEQKVKNRWVSAGTADTLAAAEKELTSLTKTATTEETVTETAAPVQNTADKGGPNTSDTEPVTDEGIVPVETEKEDK